MKKQEIKKINEVIFNLFSHNKYIIFINAMAEKPFHHLNDGKFRKFRNYQGAPERDPKYKMVLQKNLMRKEKK